MNNPPHIMSHMTNLPHIAHRWSWHRWEFQNNATCNPPHRSDNFQMRLIADWLTDWSVIVMDGLMVWLLIVTAEWELLYSSTILPCHIHHSSSLLNYYLSIQLLYKFIQSLKGSTHTSSIYQYELSNISRSCFSQSQWATCWSNQPIEQSSGYAV